MASEVKKILESNFNWLNNPDGVIKKLANGDVDLSIDQAEKEIVELINGLVPNVICYGNSN